MRTGCPVLGSILCCPPAMPPAVLDGRSSWCPCAKVHLSPYLQTLVVMNSWHSRVFFIRLIMPLLSCVRVFANNGIRVCALVNACVCVCVCLCVCVCVCVYLCMCIELGVFGCLGTDTTEVASTAHCATCTHTHTHAHTCTQAGPEQHAQAACRG
jgi:hypothetical protein